MSFIYHITSRKLYQEASQTGIYTPATFEQDGFMHLSQKNQLLSVANNFYLGQTGLVCLVIDPEKVRAELKYEPPVHPGGKVVEAIDPEDLFPHLYGALNTDAVVSVFDMTANASGVFTEFPG